MFEVFSDIYFVVYNLYYMGQNDDLGTCVGPIHRDGGSSTLSSFACHDTVSLPLSPLSSLIVAPYQIFTKMTCA
jgi:hypothetical protein